MYRHIEKDEKKLTDDEIVKALDCCVNTPTCDGCPIRKQKYCQYPATFYKAILDLIHRSQEENERLMEENRKLNNEWDNTTKYCSELQKQVDELKASREIEINELHEQHAIVAEEIKKDTAKEIYAQVLEWSPVGENYHWFITTLENWLKEKYGLEVE